MSIKVYTATSPAKLLLVDDHPMIRRGLADLLGFENNISVVAEANHGEEALAYLANYSVDLIVLGVSTENGKNRAVRNFVEF